MANFVVGIDLGTTKTCASIFLNGKVELLENAEDELVTPSFVFFDDIEKDEVIVGPLAKKMADNKPEFGVYDFKRLIGRDFEDSCVQNNRGYYPFTIEEGPEKNCSIVIDQNGQKYTKDVEEIISILLQKVKRDVSTKMKSPVDKAVITVPAYFNQHQREATLKAAQKAGFTVMKLLNEPTAAALSYFHEREMTDSKAYYLVYDLGAGTFDVAILKRKRRDDIEIVSVDGDSHLGGRDFDALITDYVCEILLEKYEYDAKKDKRSMQRLQTKSEEAKKTLSFAEETEITLESFVPEQDAIVITLTRNQFETMALHLFEKSIEIVDLCLKYANIQKEQIKGVILSGGSTRIPKIQEMISNCFDGIALDHSVHADWCVAIGASIQAALFSTNVAQEIDAMQVREVTPISLGSCDWTHEMNIVIRRNTPLPARGMFLCSNTANQQTDIAWPIYEGERNNARKNRFLGEVTISNLTPAPPRKCRVTLTLDLDQNGLLTATAQEEYRGVKALNIEYTRATRSNNADIKNSFYDAQKYKDEEVNFLRFLSERDRLLKYCTACIYNIEKMDLIYQFKSSHVLCKYTIRRIRKFDVADQSEMEELRKAVRLKLGPLINSYNFQLMPANPSES